MNIIERACERLQHLAQTGVELPEMDHKALAGGSAAADTSPVSASSIDNILHLPRQGVGDESLMSAPCRAYLGTRAAKTSETVVLDLQRLEDTGLIVTANSRSTMAEEFRHIKRPLLGNVRSASISDPVKRPLIMVSSALAGEGKTFFSINLAISMASEVDTSVLLVDADVVRASLLPSLGLKPRKGLMDVLLDPQIDLSTVLLKTNIPKLTLLPAGSPNLQSTELLASQSMDNLLKELAGRYSDRIIIFDTTPLLLTSEAKVMASKMGQVVVVVEESKTPYGAIEQAFAAVEKCPNVMSVLNKVSNLRTDYGNYYG